MSLLSRLFFSSFEFQDFLRQFSKKNFFKIFNLPNSALATFLISLHKYLSSSLVFICEKDCEGLNSDLTEIGKEDVILFRPVPSVLNKILNRPKTFILLLRPEDLEFQLPKEGKEIFLKLKRGHFSYERLLNYLVDAGYRLSEFVTEEGEFARRGQVIDLFPPDSQFPLRVEFFGDEIVSLRHFDPLTQRSVKELKEFDLFSLKTPIKEGISLLELIKDDAFFLVDNGEGIFLSQTFPLPEKEPTLYHFPITSPNIYLGNFKLLKSEMESGEGEYYLVCPEYLQTRLERVLGNLPIFLSGTLTGGFVLPNTKVTVLTEKEIYGTPKVRFKRWRFKGLVVDELVSLRKGDYVVHLEYGVGVFAGSERLNYDGVEKDYLVINYSGGDKLYLPVESLGLIERYVGDPDNPPKIDRLGRRNWQEAKEAAKKFCQKFAEELLNLYAQREIKRGFSFSPDTDWQMELESSFPYEETPDQLKVLGEIKRDMEKKRPMDRLVCGDVGYGKTELALRAAFKAVNDFKQVAFLVPTTLLCLQHYRTFKERLAKFPVRVEMLSRLTGKEEKEKIIKEINEGKIDIVIGTHLLLSNKAEFKDLGLLIIDEEQKFGVRQKEKIKRLKSEIDVLTLTATPIPRTLYMSLSGIKDISLINTPPLGRKEIITELINWDEGKIREAVLREVARGGQVFFIHNRVATIEKKREVLEKILPEIKIAVAHAQMSERKLARIYLDFLNKRYDLLLSTAILESGIDMPNVNTIIVDEAERFGLADLHQLRGRVGRSERQGYCLFIVDEEKKLTKEAKERIKAIVAYSKLGSGFKLALRDMEIRGVGNILGTEQHGHISRIGFNLYCQLLKEAIKKLKGEEVKPEPELSISLPAYIPEDFIPDACVRVALYKRILNAEKEEEIYELKEEVKDRFGKYPEILENLFKIGLIRIYAKRKGIKKIILRDGEIKIVREEKEERCFGDIERLIKILSPDLPQR